MSIKEEEEDEESEVEVKVAPSKSRRKTRDVADVKKEEDRSPIGKKGANKENLGGNKSGKTSVKNIPQPPLTKQEPGTTSKLSKRMKLDHDEQVSQLFDMKPVKKEKVDLVQKRYVFKLVNDNKDRQQKTDTDTLWKRFMTLPMADTLRADNSKPVMTSKAHMEDILRELEADNLVMFDSNNGQVILI